MSKFVTWLLILCCFWGAFWMWLIHAAVSLIPFT